MIVSRVYAGMDHEGHQPHVPIVTTNVQNLAEHGVLGDAWILPPPHSPRQRADFRDASGCAMTAVSVSNTSNRGCPSKAAGTTCRRDRSRISATALRSTIRCRTDPSGRFSRHAAHSRHHHPSATIPAYSRLTRSTPTHQQLVTGACSNLPTEPFPGLPIGDKGAFPLLTVSAPNSSQMYNSLQNRRDRGDLAEHHLLDHFDDLDGLTGHRITTRIRDAPTSSGGRKRASTGRCVRRHAPPPQAHSLSAFVIGSPIWAASCTPHLKPLFVIGDRTPPFHQSVH